MPQSAIEASSDVLGNIPVSDDVCQSMGRFLKYMQKTYQYSIRSLEKEIGMSQHHINNMMPGKPGRKRRSLPEQKWRKICLQYIIKLPDMPGDATFANLKKEVLSHHSYFTEPGVVRAPHLPDVGFGEEHELRRVSHLYHGSYLTYRYSFTPNKITRSWLSIEPFDENTKSCRFTKWRKTTNSGIVLKCSGIVVPYPNLLYLIGGFKEGQIPQVIVLRRSHFFPLLARDCVIVNANA